MSEPRTEDWVSHGLAAMDELRRLYFEGSADRGPGDITVKDWEPCEDAIRSAFAAALPAALDVERLARALNDTDHADCIGWDNPKAGCRGYYRRMAKAALAAAYSEGEPE